MKKFIENLSDKTIYQVIAALGITFPGLLIFSEYHREAKFYITAWLIYFVIILFIFIIRSSSKKKYDKPSLIGMIIPLTAILLKLIGFL